MLTFIVTISFARSPVQSLLYIDGDLSSQQSLTGFFRYLLIMQIPFWVKRRTKLSRTHKSILSLIICTQEDKLTPPKQTQTIKSSHKSGRDSCSLISFSKNESQSQQMSASSIYTVSYPTICQDRYSGASLSSQSECSLVAAVQQAHHGRKSTVFFLSYQQQRDFKIIMLTLSSLYFTDQIPFNLFICYSFFKSLIQI